MQQGASGLSGLVFGNSWQSAAARAAAVFVLAYVLPAFLLAGVRAAGFVQLLASVLAFAGASLAIYRFLEAREKEDVAPFDDATIFVEDDDAPPPAPRASAAPRAPLAAEPEPAQPADAAQPVAEPVEAGLPPGLGQVALERLCMAVYRFNGLRSDTVASGVPGEYRIRLFPRNGDKPMGLLRCAAGEAVQDEAAYQSLLRDMQDAALEKAFFVAPAGFAPEVVAVARSQHVTLVDEKLLRAMLDRLPAGARREALEAARSVVH